MKNLEIRVFDGCKKQKAEITTYIRNYFGSKKIKREKLLFRLKFQNLCET